MGKIAVTREYLEDIANSIREKNGTQETYKPSEMSDAIDNIQSGADLSEYFTPTIDAGTSAYDSGIANMIKTIPSNTTVKGITLYRAFRYSGIEELPLIDTSNVRNMYECFTGCSKLKTIPLLDTSNVTTLEGAFYNCILFETLPQINTQNVTSMYAMFYGCSSLKNIPLLNTSKLTDMSNIFANCSSLTDTSLDNILQMCINATNYSRTKTLSSLGLNSTQRQKCTTLSNYQDFINAGWSL